MGKELSETVDGKKTDQQIVPANNITILVKEEFDEMFNTKAGMNEKSDLERIIRANKVYNPTPIAGGGSITYYLNDKNQLDHILEKFTIKKEIFNVMNVGDNFSAKLNMIFI